MQFAFHPSDILAETLIWSYVKKRKEDRPQSIHLAGAGPNRGNTAQLWQQLPLELKPAGALVPISLEVFPGTSATLWLENS